MDKYLCRKDVYDEIEKAMRDRSHLTEKVITDKNGHQRKVLVRAGEDPKKQRTKKAEEPAEKKTAKPKHSAGDIVSLDGAKGDFKVSSIDKDGTYHVVSADGKKGYKVSENHITGNKGNAENNDSESVEDLQRQIANAKAQRSFDGDMKAAELTKKLKALQSKKDLDQKKKDKEEINFEKKNNASKSEEIARKNDAENNVNDAIKLTDAEKKEITGTFTPELQEKIKKYGRNDSIVIGTIILNNLSSIGKKDLFNKIRKQEWDYKDANDKHGNTFNSDYASEAMYQVYQEYQKNGKESQKEDYSDWGDMSTEKKESPKKTVSFTVSAFRKQQQKKEKEKYDYNKRMNDFYVNTGLDGGPDAVLYRQAVEKEDNKQDNLKAGVRDDSIFNENDDVQFWRAGNYIDGKITKVDEDYRGNVSLQIESNGNIYWVETDNIIKHPASAK